MRINKEERKNWLRNLKVNDEVIMKLKTSFKPYYGINKCKIAHVSEEGTIFVKYDIVNYKGIKETYNKVFDKDGCEVPHLAGILLPLDNNLLKKIDRNRIKKSFKLFLNDFDKIDLRDLYELESLLNNIGY